MARIPKPESIRKFVPHVLFVMRLWSVDVAIKQLRDRKPGSQE
jgi:hypothetical protein